MFRIARPIASLLAVALLTTFPAAAGALDGQQNGNTVRVTGRVLDSINAQPLPGVTLTVVNTSQTAVTDLDGRYTLTLPPGRHEVSVAMDGFQTKTLQVDADARGPIELTTSLAVGGFTEEVTVTGDMQDAVTSSGAAQLMERRRAQTISDNLGSQEMKQNADSNAASALQRVTGLSVVDSQYVFVRGLGERYSNTTLGGAVVPSTQPERRVVSLDMFPAGLLDSVSVVKTYTPDRSAEFAGGLVEVVPSKLPVRPMFDVAFEAGANSLTFGKDVFDYAGSGSDWLAYDDGMRSLPGGIPDRRLIRGGIYTPELGFGRDQLKQFGESFQNLWEPESADGRANTQWSAAFGRRWGAFGVLGSFNQTQRGQYREEVQNYYRTDDAGLTPFSEYDYRAYDVRSAWAAMLNAGYQLSSNNRLAFQGFSTNTGTRESRQFEGFNADAGLNLRNQRLMWLEENLQSGQLTGEHFLPGLSNSRFDWRASVSRSNRDEPDLRETLYQEIGGRYLLADESQSGIRMFNDLDEDAVDVAANWSTSFVNWKGLPTVLKVGTQYTTRQRDFGSRRFRFIPLNTSGLDLSLSPEQLFTPANIGTRFELREETRATDFYDAEQNTAGGYAMLDIALSNTWRLVGGLRAERFDQTVNTFDLFDTDVDDELDQVTASLEDTDVFPALNVVNAIRPNQNLRFGVSQTVNRPEFRELAPFEFTDIVGGRAVVGNPNLSRTLIQNYDLRWEWFGQADEVISAGAFLKNFNDPIERFVEPTAQLRTSFQNADSARNFGLEFEARKRITPALMVGGNYTYVDSAITLAPSQTNVLTSLERPLAGTSQNLFNGFVEGRTGALTARVLANYYDDRIADVGSLGLPDILEKGRLTFDFAAQYRVRRLTLRFSADNLTDEAIEYQQGGELQRRYTLGRTFALQFGFSAF
jgi:outer membrane receptor protein involved in Fe transport